MYNVLHLLKLNFFYDTKDEAERKEKPRQCYIEDSESEEDGSPPPSKMVRNMLYSMATIL